MNDLLGQQKEAFLSILGKTACNISEACKQLKISRTTYYEWRKADEIFQRQVEDIQLSLIDMAEGKLFKNIIEGKETSLIFFLTNRAPDRWKHKDAQRQQTAVFVNNSGDVTTQIKEIYGDDSTAVAHKLAEALGITVPSGVPQITE